MKAGTTITATAVSTATAVAAAHLLLAGFPPWVSVATPVAGAIMGGLLADRAIEKSQESEES